MEIPAGPMRENPVFPHRSCRKRGFWARRTRCLCGSALSHSGRSGGSRCSLPHRRGRAPQAAADRSGPGRFRRRVHPSLVGIGDPLQGQRGVGLPGRGARRLRRPGAQLQRLSQYLSSENYPATPGPIGSAMNLADGVETLSTDGKLVGAPLPELSAADRRFLRLPSRSLLEPRRSARADRSTDPGASRGGLG